MTPADETRTQRHLAADQAASDERTRPTEGPDREALARRILIALTNVPDECAHERHGIPGCVHCDVDAVLALLPTPPAPGDWTREQQHDAECGNDGCPGYDFHRTRRPAPGGGEGLRAEVERLRTYHVRVPEMNGTFLRLRSDRLAVRAHLGTPPCLLV
jgi:hypothetical protein